MVIQGRQKRKSFYSSEQQDSQNKLLKLKQFFFQTANVHLMQNQTSNRFVYYLFLLLEHIILLWYILHPGLNIFGDVYLIKQVREVIEFLNFQEYLRDNQGFYRNLIGILLANMALQSILVFISCYAIIKNRSGEFFKYIRKIVNLQFIFNVKVVIGPTFAVIAKIVYCNQNSPYRVENICYQTIHIVFCILAGIVALSMLFQILIYSCFYYIKNPLSQSTMGDYRRYYALSKNIIKILLPIYFTVDFEYKLSLIYLFLAAGLWAIYIFWHRLFSIHSYKQQHFYVQYFMECFLFWMAANNIISYFVEQPNTNQKMSLIYSLFSASLVSILLMNVEKTFQNKFVEQCLEKKVKKPNMEKFIFILINKFLHYSSKQAKLLFKVYSKIIMKNVQKYSEIQHKLNENNKISKSEKQQIYLFLCVLTESFLLQNNSIILKTLKCYLLCHLGQKSYGLHQSLQLQSERLGISDQFMLFQFRNNQNVFISEIVEKTSIQFVKYYRFHEQFGVFQEQIELCAQNNAQYWDQLCEPDPSYAKLRNLATLYLKRFQKITKQYNTVISIFPQDFYATNLYLTFLMDIGVDIKQTIKTKQKLQTILQVKSRNIRSAGGQLYQSQEISILTLDSIGNNLGIVMNSSNNIKQILGYDKVGIIGKNVTKLMPKIYSELHNSFMLKFIRSQTSHLRPSDKTVTALNKDSLLVMMKLSVRMMIDSHNTLVVVGFIKKVISQPEDKDKGTIMISANSFEILGIDAQFQKIMNYKLRGKQIVQEQIKIASIMPQINNEFFKGDQEICFKTVLQVGTTQDQQQYEMDLTKRVMVTVSQIKFYEGIKIAFLHIQQQKFAQKTIYNLISVKPEKKRVSISSNNPLSSLAIQSSKQKLITKDDISLNITQLNNQINEDGLREELPTVKKMQQFINKKTNTRMKSFTKILQIAFIICCSAVSAYTSFSHFDSLLSFKRMYHELNITISFSYCVSRNNLLADMIWSVQEKVFRNQSNKIFPTFQENYILMKDAFKQIVVLSNQYDQNLQYNKINTYPISYGVNRLGTILIIKLITSNMNLFNGYLSSSNSYLHPDRSQTIVNNFTHLQALYIRLNGDQVIPNITSNAITLFKDYFEREIQEQFSRMIGFKSGLIILSILAMIIIITIGNHIDKVNSQVVQIYRGVRLWDINQLSSKCISFLTARGTKIAKRRSSSLLKIFPLKTLVDLISSYKVQDDKSLKKQKSKTLKPKSTKNLNQSLRFRQAMSPDPLMTPYPMSQVEHVENEEQQLKEKQIQPKVQLFWESNNTLVILGMVMIFLTIGGLIGYSLLNENNNKKQLKDMVELLQNVGRLRITINYINYFTYRIINNPNDTVVRSSLKRLITEFYQESGKVYHQLGDPYPVLKSVYTYVETVQQWLSVPNISSRNILLGNFSAINDGIIKGSKQILTLMEDNFKTRFYDSISTQKQVQLIISIIIFLINCFFLFILDCLYLKPLYQQAKHSLNMIKILPAWVFQRNQIALKNLQQ